MTRLTLAPKRRDEDGDITAWNVWCGPIRYDVTVGSRGDWEVSQSGLGLRPLLEVSPDLSGALQAIHAMHGEA